MGVGVHDTMIFASTRWEWLWWTCISQPWSRSWQWAPWGGTGWRPLCWGAWSCGTGRGCWWGCRTGGAWQLSTHVATGMGEGVARGWRGFGGEKGLVCACGVCLPNTHSHLWCPCFLTVHHSVYTINTCLSAHFSHPHNPPTPLTTLHTYPTHISHPPPPQVTQVERGQKLGEAEDNRFMDVSVEELCKQIKDLAPEESAVEAVRHGLQYLDAGALAALLKVCCGWVVCMWVVLYVGGVVCVVCVCVVCVCVCVLWVWTMHTHPRTKPPTPMSAPFKTHSKHTQNTPSLHHPYTSPPKITGIGQSGLGQT